MTNLEKIKAMSAEEMADFLVNRICTSCRNCPVGGLRYYNGLSCLENYKSWLESEVEEDVDSSNK